MARDHHRDDTPLAAAGPRPGTHPEVHRSGTSRRTAWTLAVLLVLSGLVYLANWAGIIGQG